LNVPVYVQYGRWVSNIRSPRQFRQHPYVPHSPSPDDITAYPLTFELGLMALIIGLLISIPSASIPPSGRTPSPTYFLRSLSILLISIPASGLGTMIVLYPSHLVALGAADGVYSLFHQSYR